MFKTLWIVIGSGLGGVARWSASGFMGDRFGQMFPSDTLDGTTSFLS